MVFLPAGGGSIRTSPLIGMVAKAESTLKVPVTLMVKTSAGRSPLVLGLFVAIALIAVAIGMKFGSNLIANFIFGQKRGKAIRSASTLAAPRGEFSIVIVKVGVDMGAVSAFLFPLIGMISIITAILTPFLMKAGDKIIPAVEKKENA